MNINFVPTKAPVQLFTFVTDGIRPVGFCIALVNDDATIDWQGDGIETLDASTLRQTKPVVMNQTIDLLQAKSIEIYNAIYNDQDLKLSHRKFISKLKIGDQVTINCTSAMRKYGIGLTDVLVVTETLLQNQIVCTIPDGRSVSLARKQVCRIVDNKLEYYDAIVVENSNNLNN